MADVPGSPRPVTIRETDHGRLTSTAERLKHPPSFCGRGLFVLELWPERQPSGLARTCGPLGVCSSGNAGQCLPSHSLPLPCSRSLACHRKGLIHTSGAPVFVTASQSPGSGDQQDLHLSHRTIYT